jgi:hypothetical protein
MNCPISFYISRDELEELRSLINTITIGKARRNRKQAILRLRRLQNRLLKYIGHRQSISPSDLSNKFSYSSKGVINYTNAKRHLRKLAQLKLIEIDRKKTYETEKNKKKYYKLSNAGIYYLISNHKNLEHGLLRDIIIYDRNHILFRLFLYICVEYDTLHAITDTTIFSRLCEYLHSCCKDIEQIFEYIDKTYNSRNGYLIDQIFVWDNIPRMDYDTNALRNFLKKRFSFDWVEKSNISKSEDENEIRITFGMNMILLSLNKERTKAILSYRGRKLYEFIINELPSTETSMAVVYTDEFLWPPAKTFVKRPLIEVYLENFRILLQTHIIMLIFSLSLNYRVKSPTIEILANDKCFQKQLEMARHHFENWCSFF